MHFQDNRIHPEDKRNLVIFFALCVAIFFLYDIFIHQPRIEAMKKAQEQAAIAQTLALSSDVDSAVTAPQSRETILIQNPRITVDTATLSGSLPLVGSRIDDLVLKNYAQEAGGEERVVLFSPVGTSHPHYGEFGWLAQDKNMAMPDSKTRWQSSDSTLTVDRPVTFRWDNGQGLVFTRTVAIDDRYMFTVTQSVTNNSDQPVTLYPYSLVGRIGLPQKMVGAFILHEGPIGYVDGELYEPSYKDLHKGEEPSARSEAGWIGMTQKYWLAAVMPSATKETGQAKFRFVGESSGEKTKYQTDMMGGAVSIAQGESISIPMQLFAGPKIVAMLDDYAKQYDIPHFDLAVDFGIYYFMTRPFYEIMAFLERLFGSFAVSLLIFTVIIRACVFPLAQKSYRSFARMRKVSPQMVELREKYGHDKVKLQQEIFALYQRENVNPVAGCFPILIQIPIFFALYKVFYVSIDMRHAPFWGWIDDMSAMDPTNIFNLFGLIPWDAPSWLMIGAWPVIMGFTMALQQRLSPPAQDPIQQKIMMFLPFWITFILAKFPAGLVIYWSWSNLLSIIQQYVLLRQEGVKVNIFTRSRSEEKLEKLVEEGPAVHPELDVIEHELFEQSGNETEVKQISAPKRIKKKKK